MPSQVGAHSVQELLPDKRVNEVGRPDLNRRRPSDHELDRIARGQKRELPRLERVEKALGDRAQHLEREGWGVRSDSGKFYFRDGARAALRAGELDRAGLVHAREHGLAYRDLTFDPPLDSERVWQVREVKHLFAGRTAIIGRGNEVALVGVKAGKEIGIGDQVGVEILERGGARSLELIAPRQLAKELELSRGLGLGLGR